MPKLSDTQLVILSAACAREDRRVLPLPKSLKAEPPARSSRRSLPRDSLKK